MDAPNEEFRNFIFTLYADFHNNGTTKITFHASTFGQIGLEYNRMIVGLNVVTLKYWLSLQVFQHYELNSLP